jgi:PAS domain S-box-containing protein
MVNCKLCHTWGYTYGELQKLAFQDVTHPDVLKMDLGQVCRLLSGEIEEYFIDTRYKKRDGGYLWGSLSVFLVRKELGEPSYFISVIEDIDERKRAELAVSTLTPCEKEVLLLLARGWTNVQIAEALHISERTAKFYVHNVTEKLGGPDRKRTTERAIELSLVSDEH